MSYLSEDPLTGRRVIIAENRLGRPNEFAESVADIPTDDTPRADCPFCPGNETHTPTATHESLGDDGRWLVRAIPNKYPAVDSGAGQGVHEVIIESTRHTRRTGELSVGQLERVLGVYARRLIDLADDGRFPYRLIFKNVGGSAGASLEHLHSQLIALPSVPPAVAGEMSRLADYRREKNSCGWCDRFVEERAAASRVVLEQGGYLAFCPAASRQPFETWIAPAEHHAWFESSLSEPDAAARLAPVLHMVIRAVESEIGAAGYNVMIHTAAKSSEEADPERIGEGHWRLEIVPRMASLAGLELATGLFMNVLSPERAAEKLRARIAAAGHRRP